MQHATITFDAEIRKQKCRIKVDLSAEYCEPIPAEAIRQLLVQIAIRLTNPDELDSLVNDFAPPVARAAARAPNPELPPPLLRAKLSLLKKTRQKHSNN